MTTILNISAYKFEVLDQQPILQEQRLAATLRRGSTPEGFRRFAEMIGVSKSDGWIDYSVLEECIRVHLDDIALRLVSSGSNAKTFKRCPRKDSFVSLRLRGFACASPMSLNAPGSTKTPRAVNGTLLVDTKSGTPVPGTDTYKVKGNLHWGGVKNAYSGEVRLIESLFSYPTPGLRRVGDAPNLERDFLTDLNPQSLQVIQAAMVPSLKEAKAEDHFQFEHHGGYFVADRQDLTPGLPVFNLTVTLKDSGNNLCV